MLQNVAVFGNEVICFAYFFANKIEKAGTKDYLPINKTSLFASFSIISLFFFH